MDYTLKPPTAISLCTGGRGLDRGLERGLAILRNAYRNEDAEERYKDFDRSVEYVAYVENEAFAAYNLAAQMEQGVLAPVPIWTDVKTFQFEAFYGKVCVITGGYPCQPFSNAGKQKGVEDQRHLFPYFERGVDAARPVLCFFENVGNHINIGYEYVRTALEKLGYTVEEGIFSAEEVGAPHLRKRLFILAVANTYCGEPRQGRGNLTEVLGLPEIHREPKYGPIVFGRNRKALDNANGKRQRKQDHEIQTGRHTIESSGQIELDHTTIARCEAGVEFQSEQEIQEPCGRCEIGVGQANSESKGQQGRRIQSRNEKKQPESKYGSENEFQFNGWPAGQGQYQHSWEHPRIESRLGATINGYDYTEDLLRMAGNAVVEQQAEYAFITLLMKFL